MNLSKDYKKVTAIFNTPLEEPVTYSDQDVIIETEFKVGPSLYRLELSSFDRREYEVEFELIDIDHRSDKELVEIISRIEKRSVSLEEAKKISRDILNSNSMGILGLGEGYSVKVLGTVLRIIQDFVKRYKPRCISFTSGSQGRTDVYHRMVKRAFPEAAIGFKPLGTTVLEFTVCSRRK